MIEIKLLESPDSQMVGNYKLLYDEISIGSSFQNDIIINDKFIEPNHIIFSLQKNTITLVTIGETSTFLFNSKIFKGKKNLDKKDKIKIGNTLIEIVDFLAEPEFSKAPSIKESYEKLIKDFPEQEKIIDGIENEMAQLESNQLSNS